MTDGYIRAYKENLGVIGGVDTLDSWLTIAFFYSVENKHTHYKRFVCDVLGDHVGDECCFVQNW